MGSNNPDEEVDIGNIDASKVTYRGIPLDYIIANIEEEIERDFIYDQFKDTVESLVGRRNIDVVKFNKRSEGSYMATIEKENITLKMVERITNKKQGAFFDGIFVNIINERIEIYND